MKYKRNLYLCTAVLLFSSWQEPVEKALSLSGENRQELERVLVHFQKDPDSLKFKSACFLIENMQPSRLIPKYYLMLTWLESRKTKEAESYARIIIEMKPKVVNQKSIEIQNAARSILKKYGNQILYQKKSAKCGLINNKK